MNFENADFEFVEPPCFSGAGIGEIAVVGLTSEQEPSVETVTSELYNRLKYGWISFEQYESAQDFLDVFCRAYVQYADSDTPLSGLYRSELPGGGTAMFLFTQQDGAFSDGDTAELLSFVNQDLLDHETVMSQIPVREVPVDRPPIDIASDELLRGSMQTADILSQLMDATGSLSPDEMKDIHALLHAQLRSNGFFGNIQYTANDEDYPVLRFYFPQTMDSVIARLYIEE